MKSSKFYTIRVDETLIGGIFLDYTTIGAHIRKYRVKRNLKQDEFAEIVGLSPNYYGAIERGEKIPSLETFIAILNALDVTADPVLEDVLSTGYTIKNSALDERMNDLPEAERARIHAVIETLLQYARKF